MWDRVPDLLVMRYTDDELPRYWRTLLRAGVILSPGLRHRVQSWRKFSLAVTDLCSSSATQCVCPHERAHISGADPRVSRTQ